jgi:hypothetical protein
MSLGDDALSDRTTALSLDPAATLLSTLIVNKSSFSILDVKHVDPPLDDVRPLDAPPLPAAQPIAAAAAAAANAANDEADDDYLASQANDLPLPPSSTTPSNSTLPPTYVTHPLTCPFCQLTFMHERSLRAHLGSTKHQVTDKKKLETIIIRVREVAANGSGEVIDAASFDNPPAEDATLPPQYESSKQRQEREAREGNTSKLNALKSQTFVHLKLSITSSTLPFQFSPNSRKDVVVTKVTTAVSDDKATRAVLKNSKLLEVNGIPFEGGIKALGSEKARPIVFTLMINLSDPTYYVTVKPRPLTERVLKSAATNTLPDLLIACQEGDASKVKIVVEGLRKKADRKAANNLNAGKPAAAPFDILTIADKHGSNSLHYAAGSGGGGDVLACLISDLRVPVDSRTSQGRTPLHWACRNGHLETCELLVASHGADLRATSSDGTTCLHWSLWNGHADVAEWIANRQQALDVNELNK